MSYQNAAGPNVADVRAEAIRDQLGAESNADSTVIAAEAFRFAHAVLVRGKAVRRHLYLSLAAAERAVARARANGGFAEMVLVRMVPVDARHLDCEVTGDE